MRFVRFSIAVAATGLAVALVPACDSDNKPLAGNPRQVTVIGSGQVQGAPDRLIASVGIEFTAPDVTSAMNQTNDRQQAVITALVGAGVDRKHISTIDVSLQPLYSETGTPRTITGYRADNSIRVTIQPTDSASHLLAVIVDTGGDATRINSVSYSVDDDSQLMRDARARAFDDAKDRAQQYARLSGLALSKVISISEGGPQATATPSTGAPRSMTTDVPLEPGQQPVSVSVTVIWELR